MKLTRSDVDTFVFWQLKFCCFSWKKCKRVSFLLSASAKNFCQFQLQMWCERVTHTKLLSLCLTSWSSGHMKSVGSQMQLEDWISDANKESPTVAFWLLIRKYDQLIFMFIRAHREGKFDLMIESLQKLAPLYFAMDHQNYARWIPIFIRDLQLLPQTIREEFEKWKLDYFQKQQAFLLNIHRSSPRNRLISK